MLQKDVEVYIPLLSDNILKTESDKRKLRLEERGKWRKYGLLHITIIRFNICYHINIYFIIKKYIFLVFIDI